VGPLTPDGWPADLDWGCAGNAIEGEERSGDLAVLAPYPGGALVAVIDGLGHGDAAADAAEAAAAILREHPDEAPQALFERCHRALRRTRGVVMTLAWFDLDAGRLRWVGVGNVEARLLRAGARADGLPPSPPSPLVLGGVVGYQLPKAIRAGAVALEPGDAVVFATDGVAADYSAVLDSGIDAQAQAEHVLDSHGKGSDDALAVVVRWCPDGR
jgi:negative regulator of sigma-B (phosphoserine phosphatase)